LAKENKIIKVYVDNCVLSKLLRNSYPEEQLKALDRICDCNYVGLYTSEETLKEFVKTQEYNIRVALKVFYKLLKKISNVNTIKYKGGWSFPWKFPINFGTVEEDEIFSKLKKIFKNGDEVHIYNAMKADCKYFLTSDYRTILNKIKKCEVKEEMKEICPNLEFVDPEELLEKLL